MSRGFPSMTALLGLLAVAGYQNRNKIAEWLGGAGQQPTPGPGGPSPARTQGSGLSGILEQLRENLVGTTPGGILGGGLAELVDRFKQNGYRETAESWVGTGPNRSVTPAQLQQAIGPDVLETLSRQTGLPQQELLARLSRELPKAVDRYTPQGRLPTEAEFARQGSGG